MTQVAMVSPNGLPLGLAGATAATRYVGGTTSGAPISGTFAVGDFVIAENGAVWVNTAAGSPGTWVEVGVGGAVGITSRTVIVNPTVSYTPPTGTLAIFVQCVGGGGGGGGCTSAAVSGAAGGGGGGGSYSEAFILAPGAGPFTVAVGVGGLSGANTGGTGGSGGITTFGAGSTVRANGGLGGVGGAAGTTLVYAAGGSGGSITAAAGDVLIGGTAGGFGITNTGLIGASGQGGPSAGSLGGGGREGLTAAGAGMAGRVYGGGGGGALVLNASAAAIGGVGAVGLIVVSEYA